MNMNLFDSELETLPGVLTEIISEYNSGYDTSLFGTTESMVVIGTAFNGPVGQAVPVYSPEHAAYIFGDVYDAKTKREATLVANIEDAWATGCRTIYAVRVSGKDICKDYELAANTDLKLRVAGLFPSNLNKKLSMELNLVEQNLYAKIYKPADRATIQENKAGQVKSTDSVMVCKIDLTSAGLTLSSQLTDLIKAINSYSSNNVLKLSIVDGDGNDVTLSSAEAKGLQIRDAFSGLYTIGRCRTLGIADTVVKVEIKNGEAKKSLKLNSDVTAAYPIYAESKATLSALLQRPMATMFDFCTVSGALDDVFEQDSIDYEQVNLTDFDLYHKLGSGFAINAQLVESNGRYKVKEVDDESAQKKTPIKDGIYSMLENLDARYRVLAGVAADTKIKNRLPRKEDFKEATSVEVTALDGALKIETIVDKADLTAAKSYELEFVADRFDNIEDLELLLDKNVAKLVTTLNPTDLDKKKVEYAEGALFLGDNDGLNQLFVVRNARLMPLHESAGTALDGNLVICDGLLYVCKNNIFVPATKDEVEGEYISVMLDNGTFCVAQVSEITKSGKAKSSAVVGEAVVGEAVAGNSGGGTVVASGLKARMIGTLEQLLSEEEKVVTSIMTGYGDNKIVICSPDFDVLTVEEVVDMLNEDAYFSKLFKVSINQNDLAQEIMEFVIDSAADRTVAISEDRNIIYNVNKLIPYRTDDTFVRQLAQHCMYTSMKTAPTHGFIGSKLLLDTSLTAIANRVAEVSAEDMSSTLIAKKPNGTNVLDLNSLPYPIGRKVSVTFGQYIFTTDSGYSYVSNMAAGYAGMVSNLSLDQSSTCQPINIPTPMFELTNYQLTELTKAGYVTVKNSYTKGYVITDGITMANVESPFKRLSATRIADGIEDVIREVCEPYIGKTNNLANQNSLRSAIKSELDKLKGQIIEDYGFTLSTDTNSASLGILSVEYAIVPLYEIKQIKNKITIKES